MILIVCTENEAGDGSLHGHIVAVNKAHLEAEKRFEKRKQITLASDDRGHIPIMEEIESTNEGSVHDQTQPKSSLKKGQRYILRF